MGKGKTPADSPALSYQSNTYPPAWQHRVPKRVKMLVNLRPDIVVEGVFPRSTRIYAHEGHKYDVWVNVHGAVVIICDDGEMIGAKSDEFEVIEWHVYELKPSDLELNYTEWLKLIERVGRWLDPDDLACLDAWNAWDLSMSPMDDGRRSAMRRAFFRGWWYARDEDI